MYTLYKFHFLNGISEINQLFDDILIIWPAPVYIYIQYIYIYKAKNIGVPFYENFKFNFVTYHYQLFVKSVLN